MGCSNFFQIEILKKFLSEKIRATRKKKIQTRFLAKPAFAAGRLKQ
jgi:hypothetical protein